MGDRESIELQIRLERQRLAGVMSEIIRTPQSSPMYGGLLDLRDHYNRNIEALVKQLTKLEAQR